MVSVSVALAEPSASKGSSPLVMRHCLAGASPEQVHVRLSVVNTGTATVSTGIFGLYLATRRAVEPPLVRTTINDACTCSSSNQCMQCIQSDAIRFTDEEGLSADILTTNNDTVKLMSVACLPCTASTLQTASGL